ncbi:hypothetical protein EMIHUDRAFT_257641 [Emiliania huxleyi CCMP1516]|uniref:Uncharacterized protein n=2 Tax=Emiliania huxleyi TaxID=2903 RepID=A0A0D3IHM0_EMIH1|nr:hypothetical protein EMIHUDRAFT_257641 [Emiliania huxleyi CCMP1516]EOD10755.1 hypothetical protein EMIHUDRAFT_257641 [Emiliania huxleyi CCMP1516]|eukprot:XP_005763184.1 hypothetical protein EMIHUDRAFT_257641 [Emiliania huxleyi CCMP1516]
MSAVASHVPDNSENDPHEKGRQDPPRPWGGPTGGFMLIDALHPESAWPENTPAARVPPAS